MTIRGSVTGTGAAATFTATAQEQHSTPGQTVVVLGEGDHDTILAAAVYAYTTAPTVIAGDVTAVPGSTLPSETRTTPPPWT